MRNTMRTVMVVLVGAVVTLAVSGETFEKSKGAGIERLEAGNQRFVSGQLKRKDYRQEVHELANGQHPYAIVLSCSDSRVPPEVVFDESMGKLFVVRVAGNVIDPVALGSIEYAAEHLHAQTLYVMGHTMCGAVKATVAGGEAPPNIGAIVERIRPSVERSRRANQAEHDLVNASIVENVRAQMRIALEQSEILRHLKHEGKLSVAGGVYDLSSGKVATLVTDRAETAHK